MARASSVGHGHDHDHARRRAAERRAAARRARMRNRLLRDVANNRELGDTTTLADPAVVEEIKTRAVTEASTED